MYCSALKNILLAALGNQFSPLVYRRDYLFDGENCFPAAWHNHAVRYNSRRSPPACSLQAAECVRNLYVAEYLGERKLHVGKYLGVCGICTLPNIWVFVITAALQICVQRYYGSAVIRAKRNIYRKFYCSDHAREYCGRRIKKFQERQFAFLRISALVYFGGIIIPAA
jgi:hypothetical protein